MTTENSFSFQLNLFDMMSPTHKRIACAFAWFYKLKKFGEHKTSYPSQKTISKMAKCSSYEVSRFIRQYKIFCFNHIVQPKKTSPQGHNLYQSNIYEYFEPFFDAICFLKEKGWGGNWKKMRSFIISKVNENEELTKQYLGYNQWVMNNKNANGLRLKTQTKDLRDSSNPSRKKVPTKESAVPYINKFKKTASEEIKVPGLSKSCKAHVDRFGSLYLIQEINKDYDWFTYRGNKIRFPDQWVKSRLYELIPHQFNILRKQRNL